MTKKAELTDVSSGYHSGETLNDNFTALNDKLENTLSRDGSTPNHMQVDIDLNDNDILNVKDLYTQEVFVGGVSITDLGVDVSAVSDAVDEAEGYRDEAEGFRNEAEDFQNAALVITYKYTATAGQTDFSGADDNGNVLAFPDENVANVSRNGSFVLYSTSGTDTVVLSSPAYEGDTVCIPVYGRWTVGDIENPTRYYSSWVALKAAVDAGTTFTDGQVIFVGQVPQSSLLGFVAQSGATAITNLPGLLPYGTISPQHWKPNTTPGTTDMIDALDGMLEYLSLYDLTDEAYPNHTALHIGPKNGAPDTVSFLGERVAISRPWVVGILDTDIDGVFDTGPGVIYGLTLTNGRLVATDDFDATALATHTHPSEGLVTTVPGYLMVVGSYETTDRSSVQGNRFYVNDVTLEKSFEIDCNFMSGGIFLINSMRTTISCGHIFNLADNEAGIKTASGSILDSTPNAIGNFNPCSGAPFAASGSRMKNPELLINPVMVSGSDRGDGGNSQSAGDIELANQTGIALYTADFRLVMPIVTSCWTSIEFDMFNNAQVISPHPWANKIIYGPSCEHLITTGAYWDFTDVILYSFTHSFVNCNWLSSDSNLVLRATEADEDADGLILSGCRFMNANTIVFETEGSGTWVDEKELKWSLSGLYSEAGDIPYMQAGHHVQIDEDGLTTFSYEGAPTGSVVSTSTGHFALVPWNAAGTEQYAHQLRFDRNKVAWRFGQNSSDSNGNGFILRAPDGTDYLVTVANGGTLTTTAV